MASPNASTPNTQLVSATGLDVTNHTSGQVQQHPECGPNHPHVRAKDALDAVVAPVRELLVALSHAHATGRRWDAETQQAVLHVLQQQSEDVAAAGGALTDLEEIVAGTAPLRIGSVELGDLLMGLIPRWQARAPDHSFELALPGTVPEIAADAMRIESAVDILLEWAAQQTHSGAVRVSIHPEGESVAVAVRHFGPTRPRGEWDRIFEPFQRGVGGQNRLVRGGVGLALARAIAERHGGSLTFQAAATGEGAQLRLTLPHVPVPQEHLAPHELQLSAEADNSTTDLQLAHRARPVVLVLERDARLLRYLRANLEVQDYRALSASQLDEGLRLVDLEEPDLVIFDTGLTDQPHDALLAVLRGRTHAALFALAPAHDPLESARALDHGASEYLGKPFAIEELLARTRNALRRRELAGQQVKRETVFVTGELRLDLEQRSVTVDGKPVALSKTEFRLLRALAQNAGRILSHDLLLERVWGPEYTREVEFVWVYIRRLRRKIEPDPAHPRYILTVPGVGYRLAHV